jgi:hypothetical protein
MALDVFFDEMPDPDGHGNQSSMVVWHIFATVRQLMAQ